MRIQGTEDVDPRRGMQARAQGTWRPGSRAHSILGCASVYQSDCRRLPESLRQWNCFARLLETSRMHPPPPPPPLLLGHPAPSSLPPVRRWR